MCLGITANKHFIGNLLIYIANNIPCLYQTKLLKLLYLIDETSVCNYGTPMTWLDYEVWELGPVAKDIYYSKNEFENRFADYIKFVKTEDNKYRVIALKECDMGEFSEINLEIINSVLFQYGSMPANELVDITHKPQSLWSKIKNEHNLSFDKQKISDYTIDFRELIADDKIKLAIYDDAKENLTLFGA